MQFQASLIEETSRPIGSTNYRFIPEETLIWEDTIKEESIEKAKLSAIEKAPVNWVFSPSNFTGFKGAHTVHSGIWHKSNGQPFKWKLRLKAVSYTHLTLPTKA